MIKLAALKETKADRARWRKRTKNPEKPHGLMPIIESYFKPPLTKLIKTVTI